MYLAEFVYTVIIK